MENDIAPTAPLFENAPSSFQVANQAMTAARNAKLQGGWAAGQGQEYEDWAEEHCENAVRHVRASVPKLTPSPESFYQLVQGSRGRL
jgi:hypothetical protein